MTNASETLLPQPELESVTAAEAETPAPRRLNHLQALEAESIYILREAAAEFARPVMLYSIGKDSSVMLRLAQKAFYPRSSSFTRIRKRSTPALTPICWALRNAAGC